MFEVGDKVYDRWDPSVCAILEIKDDSTFVLKPLVQFYNTGEFRRKLKNPKNRLAKVNGHPKERFVAQEELNDYLQRKVDGLQQAITDIQSVMVP